MEQGPHRSIGDGHPGPEEAALDEPVDSLAGTMEVIDFLFLSFRDNYWRRQWQPTPVFLPEKSHGWRSLVGYSPWGR